MASLKYFLRKILIWLPRIPVQSQQPLKPFMFVIFLTLFDGDNGDEFFRGGMFRLAADGNRMVDYIFDEKEVSSELDCAYWCLSKGDKCKAINYEKGQSWKNGHICQLCNETKNSKPDSFVADNDFAYYEPLEPFLIKSLQGIRNHLYSECSKYKWLKEANRNTKSSSSIKLCDFGLSTGWYRFGGDAGTQMPTSCVSKYRCGTNVPGWMNGAHPSINEGKVTRTVCYHWDSGCCERSNNIEVVNSGRFYLYILSGTPGCDFRYCGRDV